MLNDSIVLEYPKGISNVRTKGEIVSFRDNDSGLLKMFRSEVLKIDLDSKYLDVFTSSSDALIFYQSEVQIHINDDKNYTDILFL